MRVIGRGWNLRVRWYVPEETSWELLELIFGSRVVADVRADLVARDRWVDDGGPTCEEVSCVEVSCVEGEELAS